MSASSVRRARSWTRPSPGRSWSAPSLPSGSSRRNTGRPRGHRVRGSVHLARSGGARRPPLREAQGEGMDPGAGRRGGEEPALLRRPDDGDRRVNVGRRRQRVGDRRRDPRGHPHGRRRRWHLDREQLLRHGFRDSCSASPTARSTRSTDVQLADIAITSARNFQAFTGQEPRVAMLSFSTRGARRTRTSRRSRTPRAWSRSARRACRSTARCRPTPRWSRRSESGSAGLAGGRRANRARLPRPRRGQHRLTS